MRLGVLVRMKADQSRSCQALHLEAIRISRTIEAGRNGAEICHPLIRICKKLQILCVSAINTWLVVHIIEASLNCMGYSTYFLHDLIQYQIVIRDHACTLLPGYTVTKVAKSFPSRNMTARNRSSSYRSREEKSNMLSESSLLVVRERTQSET